MTHMHDDEETGRTIIQVERDRAMALAASFIDVWSMNRSVLREMDAPPEAVSLCAMGFEMACELRDAIRDGRKRFDERWIAGLYIEGKSEDVVVGVTEEDDGSVVERSPDVAGESEASQGTALDCGLSVKELKLKILKLMSMAHGTGGAASEWSQGQVLYGLKNAVESITGYDVHICLERLLEDGLVRVQRETGTKPVAYYVLTIEGGAVARGLERPREQRGDASVNQERLARLEEAVDILTARCDVLERSLANAEALLTSWPARTRQAEDSTAIQEAVSAQYRKKDAIVPGATGERHESSLSDAGVQRLIGSFLEHHVLSESTSAGGHRLWSMYELKKMIASEHGIEMDDRRFEKLLFLMERSEILERTRASAKGLWPKEDRWGLSGRMIERLRSGKPGKEER